MITDGDFTIHDESDVPDILIGFFSSMLTLNLYILIIILLFFNEIKNDDDDDDNNFSIDCQSIKL